ncbi:tRNA cyclic N6-threonylcarbamoyladenosine(37) synthase TcdA [Sulfurivermis fontis]|uniref:tRNA cyclic N6-threonylcarbamoyladenosine(37) synthase TcdA n=1 Tax=Sulfurivermis fontis TaxID=1972068 RepID=UPI000FD971FE|nr:tRNA cyclic N6-threonylcarbamoyladenosine(37) synthase TcdA [Sulfurivermis fontis]
MPTDDRFAAIRRLYGEQGAQLIRRLHICVVGVGGVGSWAVEALARSGVGTITLIDNDTIALSNVNRQIHTLESTVGRPKVAVMAERTREINPACNVHAIDDFLTMQTLPEYISRERGYDYVIDAIDSIKFKSALIHHCRRNKIPVIMTGGAGGLTDPTKIQIADLSKTHHDALAAKVRAQLRNDYGFPAAGKRMGVECVFSSQQQLYPQADGTVCHAKPGIHGVSLDCRFGYGSATFVTATFGFFAVARAIDKALHRCLAQK